jgi:cytochrome b561
MSPSDARYTTTAIVIHWLIAFAVVGQFAWGWLMQEIPKQPAGPRADAFNLHKSIGLTLLALMIVRLLWRLAHRPPDLPTMPAWQRRAAHANHALLYALLLAMPLSGYLGSVFSGYPVRFFGFVLPAWGAKSDAIKSAMSVAHAALAWLLAAAVALHVAAAVRHAWRDRDGVLGRMAPRRRTRSTDRGGADLAR